jgi:hypothetical protein
MTPMIAFKIVNIMIFFNLAVIELSQAEQQASGDNAAAKSQRNGDQRVLAVGLERTAGMSGHLWQTVFADQLAIDGTDTILAKRSVAGRTAPTASTSSWTWHFILSHAWQRMPARRYEKRFRLIKVFLPEI